MARSVVRIPAVHILGEVHVLICELEDGHRFAVRRDMIDASSDVQRLGDTGTLTVSGEGAVGLDVGVPRDAVTRHRTADDARRSADAAAGRLQTAQRRHAERERDLERAESRSDVLLRFEPKTSRRLA